MKQTDEARVGLNPSLIQADEACVGLNLSHIQTDEARVGLNLSLIQTDEARVGLNLSLIQADRWCVGLKEAQKLLIRRLIDRAKPLQPRYQSGICLDRNTCQENSPHPAGGA